MIFSTTESVKIREVDSVKAIKTYKKNIVSNWYNFLDWALPEVKNQC